MCSLALRGFLIVVFAMAALHKVRTFLEFTGIVQQYRVLPKAFAEYAAGMIVTAEIAAVVLLVVAAPVGIALASTLLLVYCVAIAVNLVRGRRHIDCGCGGDPVPLSTGLLVRNLGILGLTVGAELLPKVDASLQHAGVALAVTLVLVLLYAIVNQLLANAGIYRRLWLGERFAEQIGEPLSRGAA